MAAVTGRLLFVVTEDWAFLRHRLPMARAAQAMGLEVAVATRVARDGDAIRALGFRLFDTPVDRAGLSPLKDLGYLFRLIGICHRFRPDLIHDVAAKPILYGTLAALLAARRAAVVNAFTGLGILFTPDGEGRRGRKARLVGAVLLALLRLLCRLARVHLLVQNRDDLAFLKARGIGDERRRHLIPGSGVDTEAFRPAPEPAGPVRAVLVGRLLWTKGVREFVAAAHLLKTRGIDVRCVLVGAPDPGNPTSATERDIAAWRREGVVEYAGEREDIAAVWADAHIAVLPSYREGLPKSLLEAAACGRPLVAADVPGCRDLVRHGKNGLLVPAGDADALADALADLVQNPERRRAMGAAARRDAEEIYSERRIGERITALYHDVLGTAP